MLFFIGKDPEFQRNFFPLLFFLPSNDKGSIFQTGLQVIRKRYAGSGICHKEIFYCFNMDSGNILLTSGCPGQNFSEHILLHDLFFTGKFSRDYILLFLFLYIASIEFIRLLLQIFLYFCHISGGDPYMAYRPGIDLLHLRYQDLPYPVSGIGKILIRAVFHPGASLLSQIFPYFLSGNTQKGTDIVLFSLFLYRPDPGQSPGSRSPDKVVEYSFCLVIFMMGQSNTEFFGTGPPGSSLLLKSHAPGDPAGFFQGKFLGSRYLRHRTIPDSKRDLQFLAEFFSKLLVSARFFSPDPMVYMDPPKGKILFLLIFF